MCLFRSVAILLLFFSLACFGFMGYMQFMERELHPASRGDYVGYGFVGVLSLCGAVILAGVDYTFWTEYKKLQLQQAKK